MEKGDLVKVFTQIGSMRKPRWIIGNVVEGNFPECGVLVDIHGSAYWAEGRNVKSFKKMSCVDGVWPELESFKNNNWSKLKSAISRSASHFFPNVKISYDDRDKIISTDCVSIGGGVSEVETIASFKEIPAWDVEIYYNIPATRYEPSDVDVKNYKTEANSVRAAKAFIDAIWLVQHENYWCFEDF